MGHPLANVVYVSTLVWSRTRQSVGKQFLSKNFMWGGVKGNPEAGVCGIGWTVLDPLPKTCYFINMLLSERMLTYFSRDPQVTIILDKNDINGKPLTRNEPNGVISKAGFCAGEGISERELDELISTDEGLRRVAEVCNTKFKYFMQVNGLSKGGWEAPFAIAMAKSEGVIAPDNIPPAAPTLLVISDADRRMLERAMGARTLDNNDPTGIVNIPEGTYRHITQTEEFV